MTSKESTVGVKVLFMSPFHVKQLTLKLAIILMSIPKFKPTLLGEGKLFSFFYIYFLL